MADRTRLYAYDREKQGIVPEALYGLTPGNCRDTEPAFSSDGRYLAFASDRPTADDPRGAGDIHLYDFREKKLVPLPGLNSFGHDCQPGLSRDGRYVVFTSERLDGAGQRDVYLYDRAESRLLPTPGLNTNGEEFEPAIAVNA
jgi:Tol biopolymer transport system component